MTVKPLAECRLYTFVDTGYLNGRAPEEIARELCAGGSDVIQLRAKDALPTAILEMATAILPITNAAGIPLVINDHPKIAKEAGAQFCHLGQEDFAPYTTKDELAEFRDGLGLGLSSHAPEQAQRSLSAGADYVAVGPVYPTPTKPSARAVTLEYVRWAAAHITIPWFAIGGINMRNVEDVMDAGARRICVVSAILNERDLAAACAGFKERLLSRPI